MCLHNPFNNLLPLVYYTENSQPHTDVRTTKTDDNEIIGCNMFKPLKSNN